VKLAFAREARNDLVRLRRFIAVHDPAAAERVARRLIGGMERLLRFPRLGRRVAIGPDASAPDEIREWLGGDYVVRYLIAGERLIVLRVWHGREARK